MPQPLKKQKKGRNPHDCQKNINAYPETPHLSKLSADLIRMVASFLPAIPYVMPLNAINKQLYSLNLLWETIFSEEDIFLPSTMADLSLREVEAGGPSTYQELSIEEKKNEMSCLQKSLEIALLNAIDKESLLATINEKPQHKGFTLTILIDYLNEKINSLFANDYFFDPFRDNFKKSQETLDQLYKKTMVLLHPEKMDTITKIYWAIVFNQLNELEQLLCTPDCNEHVNSRYRGESLLRIAIFYGHASTVRWLIHNKANVSDLLANNISPFSTTASGSRPAYHLAPKSNPAQFFSSNSDEEEKIEMAQQPTTHPLHPTFWTPSTFAHRGPLKESAAAAAARTLLTGEDSIEEMEALSFSHE